MHIAVNTRLLLHNRLEGIGNFASQSLQRIVKSHPEHRFTFIFDRPWHESFVFGTNVQPISVFPQARHPFLYIWWFEYSVKRVLDRIKPDVFLSPDAYLSLRSEVKQVPVFHDLAFEHHPEFLKSIDRWHYQQYFPRYAHKATRIATVSEYTRQDIHRLYGIPLEKMDVVYNGVNPGFVPLTDNQANEVRQQYSNGSPYFLYVGALHPRKNIANMLKAFDAFKNSHPGPEKLLIVGRKAWHTEDIAQTYNSMQHRDEVVFTGRLPDADLHQVMGAALSLVYVPFFEGFGIPIIEAFATHIPVITSAVTSMPEVAGNAALLVEPSSIESIQQAMLTMASDQSVRDNLKKQAIERSHIFTWNQTAQRLWNCIEKAVS